LPEAFYDVGHFGPFMPMPPYFELEFIALIFGLITHRCGLYMKLFGA
jgi:hypothetical protein